ncbi:MAG TPA: hypothetical protein VGL58_16220 [Caulobacteraceae bacterium]|jgi:hypothetical protein
MNKFERTVKSELGTNWWAEKNHFCALPATHLLCGFILETTPTFQFIWRYCQPICDRVDALYYLTFSERLERGYISRTGHLKNYYQQVAVSENPAKALHQLKRVMTPEEFVALSRPYIAEALEYRQPEFFAQIFAPDLDVFEATSLRQYAAILVLLGRYEEASVQLRRCVEQARKPEHAADTSLLLNTLYRDPDSAVALLAEWEAETKKKFKIP